MRVYFVTWRDGDKAGLTLAPDPATAAHWFLRRLGLARAERLRILAGERVQAVECRPYWLRTALDSQAQVKFLTEKLGKTATVEPGLALEAFAALPDEVLMRLCGAVWPGRKAKVRVPAVPERYRAGGTHQPMSSAMRLQAVYGLALALLDSSFAEAA